MLSGPCPGTAGRGPAALGEGRDGCGGKLHMGERRPDEMDADFRWNSNVLLGSPRLTDALPCAYRGVRAHGRVASPITDASFPRDSAAPVGAGSNRMCSSRRLDTRVHEPRPTRPFPSPRSRSPSAPLAPEVRPQNERLTNRRFRRPCTARTCRCHRRQDHSPERSSTCASPAAATWACRPRRRRGRVARGRTQQKRPRSKDQGRGRPTGASQTVRTAHRELDRPDA